MTGNDKEKPCCVPTNDATSMRPQICYASGHKTHTEMVRIEACTFLMGSHDPLAHPLDGEGPVRAIELDAFEIASTAVTNADFAAFVTATGYETEAQQLGWSAVFDGFITADEECAPRSPAIPWWRRVSGASWCKPEGAASQIEWRMNHPVVHVSHNDALAYCSWADIRLPTEAEWECAARGGLVQRRFPWGDELEQDSTHHCNVWQGKFPEINTGEDGFEGTAPVDAYEPNGFGLFNMVGNTWEWCSDWFDASYHARSTFRNPEGPPSGRGRVIKGGSYLCHISYCARYRVAARSSSPPNTTTGHLGFRVARSI